MPSLEAVMSLERDAVLSLGPVMSLVAVMSRRRNKPSSTPSPETLRLSLSGSGRSMSGNECAASSTVFKVWTLHERNRVLCELNGFQGLVAP